MKTVQMFRLTGDAATKENIDKIKNDLQRVGIYDECLVVGPAVEVTTLTVGEVAFDTGPDSGDQRNSGNQSPTNN